MHRVTYTFDMEQSLSRAQIAELKRGLDDTVLATVSGPDGDTRSELAVSFFEKAAGEMDKS